MTIDLGACEHFVCELRRSTLVERGQLDQLLEEFVKRNPRPDEESLIRHLVEQGVLTKFQVERIKKGQGAGLVLGPYVLLEAVGSGSMGTVHKALSRNDGKHFALKVLPRRSMWNVRLARRQVRSFSQFSHPSVVPFVDVGTAGGLHYLVWDFIEGEPLDAFIKQHGKLDPGAVARLGLQLAAGLGAAHQQGLFHGLLKPSNIMISQGPQLRILDFGIGSLLAENEGESLVDTMSTANTLTSGLDCASPESIMEPTNRTPAGDQYSLGCVLYYCLTGRYPFPEGSAVEKMMAHQFKQPKALADAAPTTPPELIAIIEKLMQKKPEDRYDGADALVEALTPVAASTHSSTYDAMATAAVLNKSRSPATPKRKSSIPGLPKSSIPGLPKSTVPSLPKRPSSHPEVPSRAAPKPAPAAAVSFPLAAETTPPVPIRRSYRGELAAAIASRDTVPAPIAAPLANDSDSFASQPIMGPIGFIAVGALVAVLGFMMFQQFLK